MKALTRGMNLESVRQRLKPRGFAPLVKVAGNHRVRSVIAGRAYFRKLHPPVGPQQPQMNSHDGNASFGEINANCATRFKSGQRNLGCTGFAHFRAGQYRIAVKPEADIVCGHIHHFEIGLGLDQVARQRGGAVAQPQVGLLQGDDIGIQPVQHLDNTLGRVFLIQSAGFADVIAGDAHGRFVHNAYIGDLGVKIKMGRP